MSWLTISFCEQAAQWAVSGVGSTASCCQEYVVVMGGKDLSLQLEENSGGK